MATPKSPTLLEGLSLAEAVTLASELRSKIAILREFIRQHPDNATSSPMCHDTLSDTSSIAHNSQTQSQSEPPSVTADGVKNPTLSNGITSTTEHSTTTRPTSIPEENLPAFNFY
ncbi:uncharacterized protein LOC112905162 [Agrilus planipennis]|uniref:Uncharacterized protein LOC112905162 n=1 Tax=Agrilus planipennis TaxID=224129 RepID=A0A7F5RA27_AGRPL|nr:uncharacterized protein LOC112905162 [Agrilus planipennis]